MLLISRTFLFLVLKIIVYELQLLKEDFIKRYGNIILSIKGTTTKTPFKRLCRVFGLIKGTINSQRIFGTIYSEKAISWSLLAYLE
jgi:hypothetical protein